MSAHDIPCGSCGAVTAYDRGCPECRVPPDRPSPLMIRGVDPDLWHQVRVNALKRKMTAGALLNEILRAWLEHPTDHDRG